MRRMSGSLMLDVGVCTSPSLTGTGTGNKVQIDGRNQDQFRAAGRAAPSGARSAAPPGRDVDPGLHPDRPAAAGRDLAADPGAGRRSRRLSRRGRRGLPAAHRRGLPDQPGRRAHPGRDRARSPTPTAEAAPLESQAADRLQLRASGRLELSALGMGALDPAGAHPRAERCVQLPRAAAACGSFGWRSPIT